MQISFHSTSTNQGNLHIKLERQDFAPEMTKELEYIRKNAKIKGFRQGAVPVSMIQKLYGDSIKADVLNKLVNKAVENYQSENKLNFIGDLLPSKENESKTNIHSDDYEFQFNVGIAPVVDLDKFIDEIRLPKYKISVSEQELDAELEAFLNHFSEYKQIDSEIQDRDMVKLKVKELQDDSIKENGIESDFSVLLDEHITEDLTQKLLGKKAGDEIKLNIRQVEKEMDDKTIRKYFLKINDDQEFSDEYLAEIESASRKVKPELSEELYKKAYGEETEINNVDQLRTRLKTDLESHYTSESNSFIDFYLYKQIISWDDLVFPDDFIKEWLTSSFEEWNNKSEHDLNHDLIHFKEGLRWQLFRKAIASRTDIDVQVNDVRDVIIRKYQAQIPGLNFTEEQWNQVAMNVLNDKEKAKEFINEAQSIKYQSWLQEQMMKTEIESSIDNFREIVKDLKAHKH